MGPAGRKPPAQTTRFLRVKSFQQHDDPRPTTTVTCIGLVVTLPVSPYHAEQTLLGFLGEGRMNGRSVHVSDKPVPLLRTACIHGPRAVTVTEVVELFASVQYCSKYLCYYGT